MTYRLLLILWLGIAPLPGWAQSSRVGVKAGASLASFAGRDAAAGSSVLGAQVGVVIHLPVTPVFSVQPELLFSQKGADDQSYLISGSSYRGRQRLNYFELPITAKFRSQSGFFGEAGPQFGLLLGANAEVTNKAGQKVTLPNRDNFKQTDWGYALGAGWQSAAGLLLGARYNGGFTAVPAAGSYSGVSGEAHLMNRAWQFYAGFIFFGRKTADPFSN